MIARSCYVFLLCTLIGVLPANANEDGSLDSQFIYEGLLLHQPRSEPIPNPKLLQSLGKLALLLEPLPNGTSLDSKIFEDILKQQGIEMVDRKTAHQNELPIAELTACPDRNSFLCTLSIDDVITIKRQPSRKYRLIWWRRQIRSKSCEAGFRTLISEFTTAMRTQKVR